MRQAAAIVEDIRVMFIETIFTLNLPDTFAGTVSESILGLFRCHDWRNGNKPDRSDHYELSCPALSHGGSSYTNGLSKDSTAMLLCRDCD